MVGSRLGAINHALLTVRYAQQCGLSVVGYILTALSAETDLAIDTNGKMLEQWLGPPLGVVPYLGACDITDATRVRYATDFSSYIGIDHLLRELADPRR